MTDLTLKDASALAGVTVHNLRVACRAGRVPGAYQVPPDGNPRRRAWYVTEEGLAEYLTSKRSPNGTRRPRRKVSK